MARSDPPAKTVDIVKQRSADICERCGWRAGNEIHHRRNRSQGVDNTVPNLVHLCWKCHRWIGENPKLANEEGMTLWAGEPPDKTPLTYRGSQARLTADGDVIADKRKKKRRANR
jgi:hypothetical protein